MGRKPGYHHSEETKARIAESVSKAAGGVPVRKAAPQAGQGPVAAPSHEGHAAGPAVAAPKDALDALAQGPVKDIVAMMLWVNRFNEPELAMQITERDLNAFRACTQYLGVVPEVRIVRPQGLPGHDAIPATRTRSAIPAADPTPPKNYVQISLVERGTQDAIRPVENTPEGYQASLEAREFQRARDRALQLAAELHAASASGNFSSSVLQDAAAALAALAR